MNNRIIAYGIDLGTTNSSLAVVNVPADEVELPIAEVVNIEQPAPFGGATISGVVPSVVAVHDGRTWVGAGAHGLRALAADDQKKIVLTNTLFHDCKNEIGTSRTYAGADNIRSPVDVAARILDFIATQGMNTKDTDSLVVTVPASFQMAQRRDTQLACEKAGLKIDGRRFLDEPCAAFIDYMARHREHLSDFQDAPRSLLVVDFGGGTCDVSVMQLSHAEQQAFEVKSLSVSRYHRLGGGDIDLAIVHKLLLPAMARENKVNPLDFDFEEVRFRFVPVLIPVAEALKVQLSNEIWRRQAMGQDRSKVMTASAKFAHETRIASKKLRRELRLSTDSSTLTAIQFQELLEPFLSAESLAPAVFEHRIECSIFAPIDDAIERAGLQSHSIDYVLSVGGSAQLPQVDQALRDAFKSATHLRFTDRSEFQHAVARGAAVQAWHYARFGKALMQPVAQHAISLMLNKGSLPLINAGTPLPFPGVNSEACVDNIAVPVDALTTMRTLNFHFQTDDSQIIGSMKMDVIGAREGQRIKLFYSFDENQVFRARAQLMGIEIESPIQIEIENPMTNVINPNKEIEERDTKIEALRKDDSCWQELIPKISSHCANLGFYSEAITWLERYQRKLGQRSPWATNMQGLYEAARHNVPAALKRYEESAALPRSGTAALFNMALLLRDQGRFEEALQKVDQALARASEPALQVLRLTICRKLNPEIKVKQQANTIVDAFGPLEDLHDYELSWLSFAAGLAGLDEMKDAADKKRAERKTKKNDLDHGTLPTLAKDH